MVSRGCSRAATSSASNFTRRGASRPTWAKSGNRGSNAPGSQHEVMVAVETGAVVGEHRSDPLVLARRLGRRVPGEHARRTRGGP